MVEGIGMDKTDLILVAILEASVFVLGFLINHTLYYFPAIQSFNSCQKKLFVYYDKIKESSDKQPFEMIAEDLSREHNYTDGYKCAAFSKELQHRLEDAGYTAYYVVGKYNSTNNNHAWVVVEVPIEAVSGKILHPDTYKEMYSESERK